MEYVAECAQKRKCLAATGTVAGNGVLLGIHVSQSTSGTIAVADVGGAIATAFDAEAGRYYPLPVEFHGTLTVTLTGTIEITVFYNPQ